MNRITASLHAALLGLLLAGTAVAGGERVNINTADAATLDRVLDGVGPSKADAIIQYRKANGPFRSPDQLASVKGIGLATVERNRDRILVAGGVAPAAVRPVAAAGAPRPVARPLAAARPAGR